MPAAASRPTARSTARPRRWLRRLFVAGLLAALLPPLAWLVALLVTAQAGVPSNAEVDRGLQQGIGWLKANRSAVLANGNSMLWRMLSDAARLNGDPFMQDLVGEFRRRYYPDPNSNFWQRLTFPESSTAPVDTWELQTLVDYQRFFVYAVACEPALATQPGVQEHLRADACSSGWLQPFRSDAACRTHQLMGLMLMRQRRCGDPAVVDPLIAHAQDEIVRELQVDFRARDPYIQRVLMLYWTDVPQRVRPAWLHRVLQAQLPDGGWADRQPIVALPGGQVLQFGGYPEGHKLTLQPPRADFHATAQGILLLSLVKAQQQPGKQ